MWRCASGASGEPAACSRRLPSRLVQEVAVLLELPPPAVPTCSWGPWPHGPKRFRSRLRRLRRLRRSCDLFEDLPVDHLQTERRLFIEVRPRQPRQPRQRQRASSPRRPGRSPLGAERPPGPPFPKRAPVRCLSADVVKQRELAEAVSGMQRADDLRSDRSGSQALPLASPNSPWAGALSFGFSCSISSERPPQAQCDEGSAISSGSGLASTSGWPI